MRTIHTVVLPDKKEAYLYGSQVGSAVLIARDGAEITYQMI